MHAYPKIYNVGHLEVKDILTHPVVVQEKVDGSQFAFGTFKTDDNDIFGVEVRSKGAVIDLDNPPTLFAPAVGWVRTHWTTLTPNYIYRGEALCKPKHNTLAYDRAPEAGFILFDVERGEQDFLSIGELADEATRLGVEWIYGGTYAPGEFKAADAKDWLARTSMLGGQKVEGFVIKAYGQYDRFNKTLMAKHVSEKFKEVHQGDWKQRNPGRKDIIAQVINDFGGPARWQKAVQHLYERSELTNSPKDIGPLLKELANDLKGEEKEAIREILFKHFWGDIQRGISRGFPEWYKNKLLGDQFSE